MYSAIYNCVSCQLVVEYQGVKAGSCDAALRFSMASSADHTALVSPKSGR